jgi:hypothetical protein
VRSRGDFLHGGVGALAAPPARCHESALRCSRQYHNALMPSFTCARADLSRLCMSSRWSAERSGRIPMTVRLRTSWRLLASSLSRSASSSRGSFGPRLAGCQRIDRAASTRDSSWQSSRPVRSKIREHPAVHRVGVDVHTARSLHVDQDGARVILYGGEETPQVFRPVLEVEGVGQVPAGPVMGFVGDNALDQVRVGVRDGRNCGMRGLSSCHGLSSVVRVREHLPGSLLSDNRYP